MPKWFVPPIAVPVGLLGLLLLVALTPPIWGG
jgi:hypothetical protein